MGHPVRQILRAWVFVDVEDAAPVRARQLLIDVRGAAEDGDGAAYESVPNLLRDVPEV